MITSIPMLYSILLLITVLAAGLWYTATRKPIGSRDADEHFMYIIGEFFTIVGIALIVLVTVILLIKPT